MDWHAHVDNYCERVDFTFWSEPVNAATNASFLIAAIVIWAILGGKSDPAARLLTVILFAIGVGSFLFHTFATRWAAMADVLPILAFILTYLFLATRRFFGASATAGVAAVIGYFPFAYVVVTIAGATIGTLNGSVAYLPVPILVLAYAAALWRRDPITARGLATGAGILVVSIFFRSIDAAVCDIFPLGTHFLWHSLNGLALGWFIWVFHRHRGTVV